MKRKLEINSIEKSLALSSEFYVDMKFFDIDRSKILAKSWQYFCPEEELKEVGAVVPGELWGVPVLALRKTDGVLAAYYNVCQHRGGPVVTKKSKKMRSLQCQYHGWTYALDGQLAGAPYMEHSEGFECKQIRLREIFVTRWEGMIFLALEHPGLELAHHLAGIPERIDPIDLARLEYHSIVSYEIRSNWKIYVDNYLEGYHLPFVHPTLNKTLEFSDYQTELGENYSLQHSPIREDDPIYGRKGAHAYYYFIFPNLMLNILPDRLQINVVNPLTIDTCKVDFIYFYKDVKGEAAKKYIEKEIKFSEQVQIEDIQVCEHVQKSMFSGAYSGGRISPKFETGIWHFQNYMRGKYQEELGSRVKEEK